MDQSQASLSRGFVAGVVAVFVAVIIWQIPPIFGFGGYSGNSPLLGLIVAPIFAGVAGLAMGGPLGMLCAKLRLYRWGALPLVALGAAIGFLNLFPELTADVIFNRRIREVGVGALVALIAHYLYCLVAFGTNNNPSVNVESRFGRVREIAVAALVAVVGIPIFFYAASEPEPILVETRALLVEYAEFTGLGTVDGEAAYFSQYYDSREKCGKYGDVLAIVSGDRRSDAEQIAQLLEDDQWTVIRNHDSPDVRPIDFDRFGIDAARGRESLIFSFADDETRLSAYIQCEFANKLNEARRGQRRAATVDIFDLGLLDE